MLRETRTKLRGELKNVTDSEYAFAIAVALKQEMGNAKNTAKKLARVTGASERTAQNWLSAVRGPSGLHLILLAQNFAAVRATITQLACQEKFSDDDIDAVVQMLSGAISLLLVHK